MRSARAWLAGAAFVALCHPAAAQDEVFRFPAKGRVPEGYPAQYAAIIAAAEQEGEVVIHSTTDVSVATALIEDFQALYPRIEVRYQDMNSNDLHNTYLGDLQTSPTSADILWSSAMDSQLRLAGAGQAQPYDSPEIAMLPPWAVSGNVAFGTTFEPIVIVYNKRLLGAEAPQTHAELARLLVEKRERFAGKVSTYDIERSGLGFLLATQDEALSPGYSALVSAMGAAGAHLVPTTEAMLKRVARGQDLIGYNALGSYAAIDSAREEALGIVYPRDYTLVISRVMLIGKKASHPNSARLWVDYLLSRRGQTVLAQRAHLLPVRADVEDAAAKLPGANARTISLGSLAAYTDPARRLAFIRKWREAFTAKP